MEAIKSHDRLLRIPETSARTGLPRTCIYEKLDPDCRYHDPTFPRPVRIGPRVIAFSEQEIAAWIEARKAARVEKAAA